VTHVLAVGLSPDDVIVSVPGLPDPRRLADVDGDEDRQPVGYGAALKRAYRTLLDAGVDVVVTLHAAGQYPPEVLPDMLRPLDEHRADAVFGVRAVELIAAIEGGMPVYKFVGNRVLSTLENLLVRTPLSELHSGYRAITAEALRSIPFDHNTDAWHFDTQVILQLHAAQLRLAEVPIGTYSSDEIGVVNGVRYAAQVAQSVAEYKLHEVGLRTSAAYDVRAAYAPKRSPFSSHARLLELLGPYPRRVLDVGSGYGELAGEMQARGHTVTAMDLYEPRVPLREFIRADFSREIPLPAGRDFDVIVLADVLEHLPEPATILRALLRHLARDGALLVSLPNAVHWSVRAHVAVGRFEYTPRGILDRGHLRFFTASSARRLFRDAGLEVVRHVTTPVPWENVSRRSAGSRALRAVELVDVVLGTARPNLFAYQHVFRLRRLAG
jgi:SAM-dependent methyltransferase